MLFSEWARFRSTIESNINQNTAHMFIENICTNWLADSQCACSCSLSLSTYLPHCLLCVCFCILLNSHSILLSSFVVSFSSPSLSLSFSQSARKWLICCRLVNLSMKNRMLIVLFVCLMVDWIYYYLIQFTRTQAQSHANRSTHAQRIVPIAILCLFWNQLFRQQFKTLENTKKMRTQEAETIALCSSLLCV